MEGTEQTQVSPQSELPKLPIDLPESPIDKSDASHLTDLVTKVDALNAIRKGYESDTQFANIYNDVDQFPSYSPSDGLLYMNEHGRSYLCVPDVSIGEYNIRLLLISHAHSMLSHLGNRKTYAYMRESLWW
ncbi:hypothetical protein BDV93DRAFT_457008 [Ceratobasidium sp. AG-I]|nr:hypothetical protein BDV93DRAFT_457008 [Ceratobasidium sp. AG-I]